ncbi:hypothetical protein [Sporosarcina jiandibaonis]|uniref:hypothetical protein n=1 Tax=Sporosarcina jiandibaonis TaxID=2715535 RepID=UPI00155673AA|nr:hypothetical protein [Sporosarcina jiandibaonis]
MKLKEVHYQRIITGLLVIIILGVTVGPNLIKPKNSLELYQYLNSTDSFDEAKEIMLDGYAENFSEADYERIKQDNYDTSPDMIRQFTVLQYPSNKKSILIETAPGLNKLKVLRIERLPNDITDYLDGLE